MDIDFDRVAADFILSTRIKLSRVAGPRLPGIAPEERQRVFERFYRIVGSDETGSGLGLSIVQRIAELHSARVDIRNGPNGRGTTFVVTFGEPM